jgi:hypothetical protein
MPEPTSPSKMRSGLTVIAPPSAPAIPHKYSFQECTYVCTEHPPVTVIPRRAAGVVRSCTRARAPSPWR